MKATSRVRERHRSPAAPRQAWAGLLAAAVFSAWAASCGGHTNASGSVGAILGKREDGRLYVRDVPAGMAAASAGLEPGDEIVAIDGRDVRTMDADAIRGAVRGAIGSTVVLTVVRGTLRRDVKVQRGPFREGA